MMNEFIPYFTATPLTVGSLYMSYIHQVLIIISTLSIRAPQKIFLEPHLYAEGINLIPRLLLLPLSTEWEEERTLGTRLREFYKVVVTLYVRNSNVLLFK